MKRFQIGENKNLLTRNIHDRYLLVREKLVPGDVFGIFDVRFAAPLLHPASDEDTNMFVTNKIKNIYVYVTVFVIG